MKIISAPAIFGEVARGASIGSARGETAMQRRFLAFGWAILLCFAQALPSFGQELRKQEPKEDTKAEFTSSGSFDNDQTKAGVYTYYEEDQTTKQKQLRKETAKSGGVELEYHVAATTPACTKIATIQVMWMTDAAGTLKQWKDYPDKDNSGDDWPRQDRISAGGYWVDGNPKDKTPYYQDDGNGGFSPDTIGSSDGKGGGKPAHTTDKPGPLNFGWTKHFEAWAVCIEGAAAGAVLAGVTWEIGSATKDDPNGKSKIVDKKPKEPTKQFKDALKSWEKSYNGAVPPPNPLYAEPGGGFKF